MATQAQNLSPDIAHHCLTQTAPLSPLLNEVKSPRAGILGPLHLSRTLYKSALFMQNKPNFLNTQINVNSNLTSRYENRWLCTCPQKQTQSNPVSTPAAASRFTLHAPAAPAHAPASRACWEDAFSWQ